MQPDVIYDGACPGAAFLGWVMFQYMGDHLLILLPADEHLDYFHLLAVNSAAINIYAEKHAFIGTNFPFFRLCTRSEIVGSYGNSTIKFAVEVLHYFPHNPTILVTTFLKTTILRSVRWYLCGYHVHFPNNSWCRTSFHMFVGNHLSSLEKCPSKPFAHLNYTFVVEF